MSVIVGFIMNSRLHYSLLFWILWMQKQTTLTLLFQMQKWSTLDPPHLLFILIQSKDIVQEMSCDLIPKTTNVFSNKVVLNPKRSCKPSFFEIKHIKALKPQTSVKCRQNNENWQSKILEFLKRSHQNEYIIFCLDEGRHVKWIAS